MADNFNALSGAVTAGGLTERDIVNLVFDWVPPLLAAKYGATSSGKDVYEQIKNNPLVADLRAENLHYHCKWKTPNTRSEYLYFKIEKDGCNNYPAQIYLEQIQVAERRHGLGKTILGRLIKLAKLLDYQYVGFDPIYQGSYVWLRLGGRPVAWDADNYYTIRERLEQAQTVLQAARQPSAAKDAVWLGDLRHRYFAAKDNPVDILMELTQSDIMVGEDKIGLFVLGHKDVELYLKYSVFDLHDPATIARLQVKGVYDFDGQTQIKDATRPAIVWQSVTPRRLQFRFQPPV